MRKREELSLEETWDLGLLYKTVEDYEKTLKDTEKMVDKFKSEFEGRIKTAEDVNKSLDDYKIILENSIQLGTYTQLAVEANVFDKEAVNREASLSKVQADMWSKMSFLEAEILQLDETILLEAMNNEENKRYLGKMLKKKAHTLSKDVEAALSNLSNTLDYPYQAYNDTKFRDIKFPDVEVKDRKYPMTYNSFEGHMEYEADLLLRREAFRVFSDSLRKYENTTASSYNAQVQKEKTLASMRGYESVFDYLLEDQEVTREMYDRQIDLIMSELAPHMRKYARVLKKIYNLEEMRYSDLKIDVDPEYSPKLSIDEAKSYVLEGLSVLGDEYGDILRTSFRDRWIDYGENIGKRTGAFCSSPYGKNSFVLMSFNNHMSEVMTLAHELGHAGHFQLTHKNQNILNSDVSMYFVEAPSTTNELILERYLLDKYKDDKRMRRWVLSQMVSKTYYHNFVTHLLEAAYQREVYKRVDRGESLSADDLNEIFRSVLEKFWGEDVVLDEGAELTWMRQPHYYMGLYSYTYSAGLTIGTQMSKKIIEDDGEVAKNWIRVLKMGDSKNPIELAREAGVDITSDQALRDTISFIGEIVDEISNITDEFEAERGKRETVDVKDLI